MKLLRDAWIVARFDLGESLRSKKALVFLVLYVVGAVGATVIFTEVLQSVEAELAETLLVARTSTPGTLTQALMESPELERILSRLVRDDALARSLVRVPPIALFYGWVTLTLAPIFAVLTSSDAISTDVASGAVRFVLGRTDRAAWALGKLLGQTALSAVAVAVGAVAAWVTGFIQLASFAPLDSAIFIARYAIVCFTFAFAHLGLAMGASQLTRSVAWSRALGLLALATVFGVHGFLGRDSVREKSPAVVDALRELFPAAHRIDLFRQAAMDVAPAIIVLVAMGLSFFALGSLRFVRRDL